MNKINTTESVAKQLRKFDEYAETIDSKLSTLSLEVAKLTESFAPVLSDIPTVASANASVKTQQKASESSFEGLCISTITAIEDITERVAFINQRSVL